jgi:hypothetical protein
MESEYLNIKCTKTKDSSAKGGVCKTRLKESWMNFRGRAGFRRQRAGAANPPYRVS